MKKLFALFAVLLILVSTSATVFPVKAVTSAKIEFNQPTYAFKGSTKQIEVTVTNTGTETINDLWLGVDLVHRVTKDDETDKLLNSFHWPEYLELYSFTFAKKIEKLTVQTMVLIDGSGQATFKVYWIPSGGTEVQIGNDVKVTETAYTVKTLVVDQFVNSAGRISIRADVDTFTSPIQRNLLTDWAVVSATERVEATRTPIKPPDASNYGGFNFDPQQGSDFALGDSRTFTTSYTFSKSAAYGFVYECGAYYWDMAVWKNGYPGQGSESLVTRKQEPFAIPYAFDMKVSVEWNIDLNDLTDTGPRFLSQLENGLRKASTFLYHATDGQMCFGNITVYDNKNHWQDANLQIHVETVADQPYDNLFHNAWPHTGQSYDWSWPPVVTVISMGRQWIWKGNREYSSFDGDQDPTANLITAWKTLIHEFGHYQLGLQDEYMTDPAAYALDQLGAAWLVEGDAYCDSIMCRQWESDYLCTPVTHHQDTWQEKTNKESCWSTIWRKNSWIFIPMNGHSYPDVDIGKDLVFSYARAGWPFYAYNLIRDEYYALATSYKIPDQSYQTIWSSPHEGKNLMALTGDVNGDGKLEVVKVSGDNLKVISGAGTGLWTRTVSGVDSYYGTGYLTLNMLQDVTGDGIPEIFVSRKTSNTVCNIYVYDGNGNLIKTLTRTVASDGNMWATAVLDVNKDGNREILCGIASNYVGNPRGACLFDYNSGNQLWFYAAGNSLGSPNDSVGDVNKDGLTEITSGWWTVHNGASGSGKGSSTYTSDSSVYVVTINEYGNEMFTWEIHGTHNHGGAFERITDMNRDGTKELIVFHSHEGVYPGSSQIFMLSPSGTLLKTFTGSSNVHWYSTAIADINDDGKDEIIAGCSDGVLRVLDYNLNVLDSVPHNYGPQAVTDLNGDGKLEIVVSDYSTRELVILDNSLDQLWKLSFPVAPTVIVSDVNGDGANELIIMADQLYVAANPTTTKQPTPVFSPSLNKISLRYQMTPVDTTFKSGTNALVSVYDISTRSSSVLLDLSTRPEDVLIGSFTFDTYRNRNADPQITRDEVVQNFYDAVPQSLIQKLSIYISKTHVLYSDLSTADFLFANFAMQILEGTRPATTQAFSVLTFCLPVPLVEPTYIYSQYGYKLAGTWNNIGGGFGTGSLKTVSVYCYVDLQVTDSLGRVIDKTTNEIPGAYYFETDLDNDGELDDMVILPDTPSLTYTVHVIAEPDAPPDSTYTLMLGSNEIGIPIAENVMLSDTPESGYELTSLADPQMTPPVTTLVVGDPHYTDLTGDLFIDSTTPLTLEAQRGSFDIASTAYRIYNSTYEDAVTCTAPETFYLTDLDDGLYYIDYYSIDSTGIIESTQTCAVNLDNSGPLITIENPPSGWALQDGVTFIASATDLCGTNSLNFSIREANGGQGIPVGFEDMLATYNTTTGKWELFFNTLQLPDGFYIVLVNAEDNLGHMASITVPYSIRNWAVLELFPATPNNRAGRTMPVKFALRVAAAVDPDQPFVYNEELTIKIYATDNPSNILQTSTFGDTARDYRINNFAEQYITNFQTLKTPKTYIAEIWRKDMLIGNIGFETITSKGLITENFEFTKIY